MTSSGTTACVECSEAVLTTPISAHRLTYWVVFSTFTVLETFIEVILYFIPFYYVLKLSFIVALMVRASFRMWSHGTPQHMTLHRPDLRCPATTPRPCT